MVCATSHALLSPPDSGDAAESGATSSVGSEATSSGIYASSHCVTPKCKLHLTLASFDCILDHPLRRCNGESLYTLMEARPRTTAVFYIQ